MLGRRLYAGRWDGREITARPVDAPSVADDRRAELAASIERLDGEIEALARRIAKSVKADEIDLLIAEKAELEDRRQHLALSVGALPVFDQRDQQRLETWRRRSAAYQTLLEAFRDNTLKAWSARGMEMTLIDAELWRGEYKGFACYLDLSLVVLPRTWSGKRRGVVKIRIQDFQDWLASVLPVVPEAMDDLSTEARAKIWLQDYARKNGHIVVRKSEVLRQMSADVGDPGKRAFERLWQSHAPAPWRKRGRRHGT